MLGATAPMGTDWSDLGPTSVAKARMRHRTTLLAGLLAAVVTSACTASSPGDGCGVDGRLVPACGTLLGITTEEPSNALLEIVEQRVGRPFDFVYRFHDYADSIPTEEEKQLIARGTYLHLAVATRRHDGRGPAYTWREVAAGAIDEDLRRQARALAALGTPLWLTMDHEADQQARESQGAPADYIAAWRHMHTLFMAEGATNAVWTWVLMGSERSVALGAQFWPGNEYVDWISWEAYDPVGCRAGEIDHNRAKSFEESFLPMFNWLQGPGKKAGIDASKPIMISEAGTAITGDVNRRARWYEEIPSVLTRYPQIKAIGLWDHDGKAACDYRFSTDPNVVAAIAQIARQAHLDPLRRHPSPTS